MTLSARDGSLNPVSINTAVVSGEHVYGTTPTDAVTGNKSSIANHSAGNQAIGSTVYGLLIGSIGKLKSAIGNFDVWRSTGFDLGSAEGVPAVGNMLRRPILATTSSSVGSGIASVTLAMTDTTNFIAGNTVNLEPGTARYESGRIRSVITNTSIAVDFPAAGGTVFSHTGSFTLETFLLNEQREAAGTRGVTAVNAEGTRPTFRYSVTAITPVATPTDFVVIQGAAGVTGRIKHIRVGGIASAAGTIIVDLLRRSTAGTIGSAVLNAITPMKHGPADAAANLTVSYVSTANYGTPGTLVAQGGGRRLFLNTASGGASDPVEWSFADKQDKPVQISGATDFLCINLAGSTLPSGTALDVEIQTEEDNG